MNRPGLLLYGAICYILFNLSFVYFAGFLLDYDVPKSINDGEATPIITAISINLGLVFLFGFFHSLMARKGFKQWWTKTVPAEAERSTYVLQSAVFLSLAMWQWRPMPEILWQVEGTAAMIIYSLFALGITTVLISTFLTDHFELFGLRQIWAANTGREMPQPRFRTPFLYRVVRHPMQLGMIVALFATPTMSQGHLLFAGAMSVYILIGLYFEERSLVREFGDSYRDYQKRVPMLLPLTKIGTSQQHSIPSEI